MARTVFTDPDAANFFNEHFVNLKMDMEKGEGINLKRSFWSEGISDITFFINGQVKLCIVWLGAPGLKELMEQAQLAFDGKGLAFMQMMNTKRGNQGSEFIQTYLTYLEMHP